MSLFALELRDCNLKLNRRQNNELNYSVGSDEIDSVGTPGIYPDRQTLSNSCRELYIFIMPKFNNSGRFYQKISNNKIHLFCHCVFRWKVYDLSMVWMSSNDKVIGRDIEY